MPGVAARLRLWYILATSLKLAIPVRARTSPRSTAMIWETPTFVEVKMDAEINSYQDDFGDGREPGV
jgi:hypothetical protein